MKPLSYHPLNPVPLKEAKLLCLKANCPIKLVFSSDFSHFLENIASLDKHIAVRIPYGKWTNNYCQYESDNLSEDDTQPRIFIFNNYQIEGTGSNDGGESKYSLRPEDFQGDKNFKDLEVVFNCFWPDMNAAQQKETRRLCCSQVQWFVNEYYGDTATYVSEQLDLEKLFAILKFHNRLNPVPPHDLGFENILKNQTPVFGVNGEMSKPSMAPPSSRKPSKF